MLTYRPAEIADIPVLMDIRNTVRENVLVLGRLSIEDYVRAFTLEGRAWVCLDEGHPVGFVCGRPPKRDVWALFIRATHEGRGIGNTLMDILERWMFSEGVTEIRLSTDPGTRAERLYQRRGWIRQGITALGEVEYRLSGMPATSQHDSSSSSRGPG